MSFEEAEILRERAEAFLTNSERLMGEGFFDLAAFSLEQYCQLILKYKLLLKTGTYPRMHLLTRLLRELSKISPNVSQLLEKEDSILLLTKLEDAYIGARYLPRRYEEVEVKALLRFVKEVFKPIVDGV
ncbi:MAG: HEPN domain-containing protein [Candidatus Brockarchaeota archaeon]|nr:HEPN domain-containing protein [Candidatus Brockarchaeota archaeon]